MTDLKKAAKRAARKLQADIDKDNPYDEITLRVTDPDDQLVKMLKYIKENSDPGHSFPIVVDPDDTDKKQIFRFDGDGSFHLSEVLRKAARKIGGQKSEATVKPISTEKFVRDFCAGKKLPITATRLEIAVAHVVGDTINVNNYDTALETIRNAIAQKRTMATAGLAKQCPRCGNEMTPVVLSGNREAWFCTNDRVSLPR